MSSVEDRSWMYQGWNDNGRHSEDWVRNTDAFLDLAFSGVSNSNAERSRVPCPCTQCRNGVRWRRAVLSMHLCKRGFMPGYTRWTEHGENPVSTVPTEGHARNTTDGLNATIADVGDARHAASIEEEPTADAKAFSAMLRAAQEPLHKRTSLPLLTAVAHLMALESRHNFSEACVNAILSLFDDVLPENHKMPKTVDECRSFLSGLKRPHNACVDNCMVCDQEGQSKEECDQSEEELFACSLKHLVIRWFGPAASC